MAKYLNQQGFKDAQFKSGKSDFTWRWTFGLFTVKRKMDHIFYDQSFIQINAQVLYDGDSDHFLLALDLKRVFL